MPISDKTRKLLWGRSGNRCAFCKKDLVMDATSEDVESIVADECHIVSSRPNGPRHEPSYPPEKFDSYNNLILLCRIHHKTVDDQTETFTTNKLCKMKSDHEAWVAKKLTESQKPLRLRRVKQNIPEFLSRLTTGKDVLDIITNTMASSFDHDELKSQEEADLVGRFLQLVQDWSDFNDDLEAGDRVQAAYNLTESLREIEDVGFCVFGGREIQLLEGGIRTEPSNWPIAILCVLRKDNQEIKRMNLGKINQGDTQQ